jgi:pimeloyl-ACP methyl ester carboxylesterase
MMQEIGMEQSLKPTAEWRDGAAAYPLKTGYAAVRGLIMYYEVHGAHKGQPLLLLHGGLQTIDSCYGHLLPALADRQRVIAVELQGHGRTADIDRELTPENLAADVIALLDALGISRADVFGFSLGALVGLQLAIGHPGRVGRLVLAAPRYRADDVSVTPPPTTPDTPSAGTSIQGKAAGFIRQFKGWPASRLRALGTPVLLLVGGADTACLSQSIEMSELIPDARLSIFPEVTHSSLMRRSDLLLSRAGEFLAGDTEEARVPRRLNRTEPR